MALQPAYFGLYAFLLQMVVKPKVCANSLPEVGRLQDNDFWEDLGRCSRPLIRQRHRDQPIDVNLLLLGGRLASHSAKREEARDEQPGTSTDLMTTITSHTNPRTQTKAYFSRVNR